MAILNLGRVSNLPTVWMNCVAAWVLSGGALLDPHVGFIALAASFIYVGGTVLNDAFDVRFDREHRPERPIPSGKISLSATWVLGIACLVFGVGTFLLTTRVDPIWMGGLVLAVLIYDYTHKFSSLGPWIMGACRFLLYVTAASAAANAHDLRNVMLIGGGVGLYVVGLSYVARGEATGAKLLRWPLLLLSAPALVGLSFTFGVTRIMPYCMLFVFCLWVGISLAILTDKEKPDRVGKAVSMLLAGLVLVDILVLSFFFPSLVPVFLAVFALTLGLQRLVPAT